MRFVDEYRNGELAEKYVKLIGRTISHKWTIMEICGGQTHTIMKYGIESLLPKEITLVHGPGCPVCVTPLEMVDKAIAIAELPGVIFTSFGDMLRVPGSKKDLLTVKSEGGDIRIVYSPLDAVKLAQQNPVKKIVFFAVGFETTAPANAMAVLHAKNNGLKNFSILCSHVLIPPALDTLFSSNEFSVQGLLAAGHVCTIMGYEEYIPISKKYKIPIVITGFEPVDILQGIYMTVRQLESGLYKVENQYSRSVEKEGNRYAQHIIREVFGVTDRKWRGIGEISHSGYKLKPDFVEYDAEIIYNIQSVMVEESPLCIAGHILKGTKKPNECEAFNKTCKPEHPLGAPMVSSEGACAAYYNFGLTH